MPRPDGALRWRDAVEEGEWDELLAADARAVPTQRPLVLRHWARATGGQAQWLEWRDSGGALRGGLPCGVRRRGPLRREASLPGGLYGGPVVAPGHAAAFDALVGAFAGGGSWWLRSRELVWAHGDWPGERPPGLVELPTSTIDVPREDFDEFWRGRFPKNRRNECNRSERRGLVVAVEDDPAALRAFHGIYLARAREWGSPAEPLAWLEALLVELPQLHFFCARHEGRVVGGHLCLEQGDELFAWLGTSERSREIYPAALLVKAEVQWCMRRGLRRLNLGSSMGLGGVKDYKRLLGAGTEARWILRQGHRGRPA